MYLPQQFFPENMVHLETLGEEPNVFLTKYEKYKHSLLQVNTDACCFSLSVSNIHKHNPFSLPVYEEFLRN